MWVESKLGVGSTFHFTIMARAANEQHVQKNKGIPTPYTDMASHKPLRILVVEDNLVNQKVALAILKKCGYTADIATNGLMALDALERQFYDVILMDIHMPEMDGLTATQHIRANWPAHKQPKIIALTADVMDEHRREFLASGMDHFVSKPIRVEALVSALNQVTLSHPYLDDS